MISVQYRKCNSFVRHFPNGAIFSYRSLLDNTLGRPTRILWTSYNKALSLTGRRCQMPAGLGEGRALSKSWYEQFICCHLNNWGGVMHICIGKLTIIHWKGNVVILIKFSSLVRLEVVNLTTSSAANDDFFFISVLVQIMACHLLSTKPLSEPILEYC